MKPLLILALTLLSGCQVYTDDLLRVLEIDQRTDGVVPYEGEFRTGLADEHCRPFERVVVPSGWCVSIRGNVGDVTTLEGDIASCSDATYYECQMFAQPFAGSGLVEIYLRDGSYIFAPLSTGCRCD
jgi:hypothetical protein